MFPWTDCELPRVKASIGAVLVAALIFLILSCPVRAAGTVWAPLESRLIADGFVPHYIRSSFQKADLAFDPAIMARKVNALLASKLQAKAKTGKAPAPKVIERYLNPILIAGAYASLRENHATLARIEKEYRVPGAVVIAVYLVETKLGRTTGNHKAFSVLANMALGGDYDLIESKIRPSNLSASMRKWAVKRARQKGNWAYEELKALLTYSNALGEDPTTIPGSVYGAIGLCQFMPTNVVHYGRDGSGDGRIDLFNEQDALFSIANFLKQHGWKPGLAEAGQQKVIYRYNHSMDYALTILEVADRLDKTDRFFGRD